MKAIIYVLFLIGFSTSSSEQSGVKIIDVHELATKLDESLLLLDVRTKLEFDQGYIPGANHINIYSRNFESDVENLDRYRPVYIYCRTGHRSISAAEKLISMGFREVYSLDGGFLRWQRYKKPIEY
jgi:rhodanese-related sulfurtransferase